jgi:hypothetical protein
VEELKQQNIVMTPVQAKAQALQHAQAADTLEKALANRPSVEELKQQNIVMTPVQAKAQALHLSNVSQKPLSSSTDPVSPQKHLVPPKIQGSAVSDTSNCMNSVGVNSFPLWLLVPILAIAFAIFYKLG